MSAQEIDDYLAGVPEPGRSTLEEMRRRILAEVPDAEQGMSYGCPAFRVGGATVAGLAAFSRHLAYLPHSGSLLSELGDLLAGYTCTKSSLHFPPDEPLPQPLVEALLRTRLRPAGTG